MDRRKFIMTAGGALVAAKITSRGETRRPNLLFIISDQFRADALGADGNSFVHTPNLDALAASGARFRHAYCPQALCSPSRASLFTGVYPTAHKLDYNLYRVPSAFALKSLSLTPNLPALLQQAGYETAYIGKWHLGEEKPEFFHYWNGYNSLKPHWMGKKFESPYRSDVETDDALKFLEQGRSKPFCLIISYYPPHTPYEAPLRFQKLYGNKEVSPMQYYAAVSAVDWNIGRLVETLDNKGLRAKTLIVFTADHGETFGRRPGSGNKGVCYDDSARVPFILSQPDVIPANTMVEGGACTLDILPTLLEAAGVPIPRRAQGDSWLKLLAKKETGWTRAVLLQNITQKEIQGEICRERAVRFTQWKLILRKFSSPSAVLMDELYNLKDDPEEKTNLLPSGLGIHQVKDLARRMIERGKKLDDPLAVELGSRYAS